MAHNLLPGDKIDWIDMDMAENGIIIKYTIKRKGVGKGDFDNVDFIDKKVLFMDNELDAGFDLFRKLMMQKRQEFLEDKGLTPSVNITVQATPVVA